MTAMICQTEQSDNFILQELQKCTKHKIKSISLVYKNSSWLCCVNIDKNPYNVKFFNNSITVEFLQYAAHQKCIKYFSSYFKIIQQFKYTFSSTHMFRTQRTVVE